jgi:hypothetical protein
MAQDIRREAGATQQGLPSRRGCALLVALVLLAIAIPAGLWASGPLSAHFLAKSASPEVGAIERTCRDGIALSLQLAAAPDGYTPNAVVPQTVRDSQVTRAEQMLPQYFGGSLLLSQLATFRTQLNQGNFVPNTRLISMTFKKVTVTGTTANASGVAAFGQDGDPALKWNETFSIDLTKQNGRWLITGLNFAA